MAMNPLGPYDQAVNDARRKIVFRALDDHDWHVANAAKWLGVDRGLVYKMMRRFQLTRPVRRSRSERVEREA